MIFLKVNKHHPSLSLCILVFDKKKLSGMTSKGLRSIIHNGEYLELMNLIQIGKIIAYAARERRESRGSHYREDFPNKKDDLNWDKTIIIRKNGEAIGSYFKKLG